MNYIISLIVGALTSIMIFFNGSLSDGYGNLTSTVLIHLVGLIAILLTLLITRSKMKLPKGLPLYLYSAGFVGIGTVMLTNLSYLKLGVSLPLALGLLGQTVFSLLTDHFGLFGMKMVKINPKKLIGLGIIGIGIFIMSFQ
ncbi:DMT family transporter [Anaerocolumna xylanovorans]|uniref:Transporter family-2 protein n=1 Tax=Anaerocolumna xylanovorans DSM 12503 TaxID=1121345 RepID=A0A1M7XZ52_9FIRM|nr:DMT family transporter [Anaerocolumna xylanovorans]SHO44408.1 transporter family-2 protein [Anaerocolumna xylanovorans DSM 12503]